MRQLRGIARVGDAVQIVAQPGVRFLDGRLAQHPQLLAAAFGEQHLDHLEGLERTGETAPAGSRPAREGGDPPSAAHQQMRDQVALPVRDRAQHDGGKSLGPRVHGPSV